ncbi:MAG TPA: hemerythrin domain-containing protein [Negativicutes bacterium]|jgi:iron-sulfur cluster repair protein YtfE (RIC family)
MAQRTSELKQQQVFEILKKDHREAEQMMKQIHTVDPEERELIFINLKESLREHMQMEEKEFYPRLQEFDEMDDLVDDALEEHDETKEFLNDLEEIEDFEDKEWLTTFQKMQKGVEHHIQDEEKEIFPGCTKHLNSQQLDEIARKCVQFKEKSQLSQSKGTTTTKKQTKKHAEVR